MPQQTASQISRLPLDVDRVVSTGSIRVHTIYVANATANPAHVAFLDNDNIPLLNMVIPAYDSDDFGGPWIADNGLKISGLGSSDVIVTVQHSAEGV